MKSWEFLIQKEGDHQWVPIPTSTFKIEPGVYRVLAHSNRLDSDLEIRISHQTSSGEDSDYDPQHYSRHVNPQGLVMIFPFRELSAGIWEIRCRSDIMSELLGETWQETLKLHILGTVTHQSSFEAQKNCLGDIVNEIFIEEETKDPPQSDPNDELQIWRTPCINDHSKESQFYLYQLEKLIQERVEPLIDNYETSFQQSSEYCLELSSSDEMMTPIFQLVLDQNTFQGSPDESVTLSGQIKAQNSKEELILTAQLCYQLKHPYTDEIIIKIGRNLSDETLPYIFKKTLVIPDNLKGLPCLSGEVLLQTKTGVNITRYPFQIYSREHYPVNYTIELFDTEHESSYQFEFKVTGKTKNESIAIELPITPKHAHTLTESLSLCNQILPPKLNRNSKLPKAERKHLDLPPVISN